MLLRIWHILPTAGIAAALAVAVSDRPLIAYAVYVAAGLIFVGEEAWQPPIWSPGYLRKPLLIAGMVLIFWPIRMFVAWRQTAGIIPQRYSVGGATTEETHFASLQEALDHAGALHRSSGRPICVFDRLSSEVRDGRLQTKLIVVDNHVET